MTTENKATLETTLEKILLHKMRILINVQLGKVSFVRNFCFFGYQTTNKKKFMVN